MDSFLLGIDHLNSGVDSFRCLEGTNLVVGFLRGFLYYGPGITMLGNDPEWFKIARFCPDMCLNGVNTQWVYSQGVIQNPLEFQLENPSPMIQALGPRCGEKNTTHDVGIPGLKP